MVSVLVVVVLVVVMLQDSNLKASRCWVSQVCGRRLAGSAAEASAPHGI